MSRRRKRIVLLKERIRLRLFLFNGGMEVVIHKVESRGETMSDMKNSAGKHSREKTIQKLMDAARSITVNADDLKENAETIITSCHTQGTKGETHKSFLLKKADSMKILAGLFISMAKRYEHAAMKLTEGTSEDEVLHKLLSYNIFVSDQIESERECYEQVFNLLRD